MNVAIFGRTPKDEDIVYVQSLINQIEKRCDYVFIHRVFYNKIQLNVKFSIEPKFFETKDDLKNKVDILFSLGGDGTLLDAIPLVVNTNIPILGINLGHLGFLTSVGRDSIEDLLDRLEKKQYRAESHNLLKIDSGIKDIANNFALNDISLRSANAGELLDISIYVDEEFLATYSADGIIVSTPTGSTAYNMSAGGPIISPNSNCLAITPICPHTLTYRPIIIPDTSVIRLEVNAMRTKTSLHLDSQSHLLQTPNYISIKKSDSTIKVIRMQGQSFFTAIRNKLMWGTNIRNRGLN